MCCHPVPAAACPGREGGGEGLRAAMLGPGEACASRPPQPPGAAPGGRPRPRAAAAASAPPGLGPPPPDMAGTVRYALKAIGVGAEEECRRASNRQSTFRYRGLVSEPLHDQQRGLLLAEYRVRVRARGAGERHRVYRAVYDTAEGRVVELGDAAVLLGGSAATW